MTSPNPADERNASIEYLSADAHHVSAHVLRAHNPAAPVFLCLPAMGVAAAYYTGFGEALRNSGVHVVISDLRGIGSSSMRASRACDFGYREILVHDLPALVAAVRERFPASPRFLFGHSLGGQLWSLYLAANPGAADGIVNIATCNVHYTGWPRPARYGVLATALWFRFLGETLGYVPAGRFGFAGDEAKTLIEDWSNNCLKGTYVLANDALDYEGALRSLQKPVLSLSLEGDRLAPRQATDSLVAKMESANVTRRHLSLAELGLARGSHFSWCKRPAAVVGAIREWINGAVKAGGAMQPGHRADAL
jgi:predicted alpha/beta hydrolase